VSEGRSLDDANESGGYETFPRDFEITSYGADFAVAHLVDLLLREEITAPSFQRGFVWSHQQASRFIESLLLGLPVPGIFLVKEYKTRRLLVIDGQQRLLTLLYFYQGYLGNTGKKFYLKGVQDFYEGLTYSTLKEEDRRKLDNSIIHTTIIQQEGPQDYEGIYLLFERINTGGTPLVSQEIRSGIFDGKFNHLLRELNLNDEWRAIFGPISYRMRDEELILRFFALYFEGEYYRSPMSRFLNHFMQTNMDLSSESERQFIALFNNTIHIIYESLGERAFKPHRTLNAAVFDAVMVGVARRLEQGEIKNTEALREIYDELINDEEFKKLVSSNTGGEASVRGRNYIATRAFQNVE
jgi:hypothetical protein